MDSVDLRLLQQEYHTVTEEKLKVGALIETVLGEDDGLVFTDGRTSKPKKLIVIGIDKDLALCFGSVLINTKLNPRAAYSDEFMSAQYMLLAENYPNFLQYNSYVDCAKIFTIPQAKLMEGQYFGDLTEDDLAGIFEILETTDTLTTKEKKRYGIRRCKVKD